MSEEDNDIGVHFSIPRSYLVVFGFGMLGIGAGSGLSIAPTLDKAGLQQCFDNASDATTSAQTSIELSTDALNLAAQHGKELQAIRRDYYLANEARRANRELEKQYERISRRVERLEK